MGLLNAVQGISSVTWALGCLTLMVAYTLAMAIYRRTLHPLAHVPGPYLASITYFYEFYYNQIRGGRYFLLYGGFVAKYGPVIRIGPDRVLLADPEHYDILYHQTRPFEKAPRLYQTFALGDAMFVQNDPALYRRQRAAMAPFFSRRTVLSQETMIKEKVMRLIRIVAEGRKGAPAPLHYCYRALAIDVVTEYAFGAENCFRFLEKEDVGADFDMTLRSTVESALHLSRVFPVLLNLLTLPLPDSWAQKVDLMASIRPPVRKGVLRVIDDVDNCIKPTERTIYHELIEGLRDHTQASRDASMKYLVDESFGIVGAAGDTTGNAMTLGTYKVLTNPEMYRRLHKELRSAFASPADINIVELEKLPYLVGVIKEALRLSYGVITPLDREVPKGGYTFNGVYLPSGSEVGMTSYLMHRDPSVFPSPHMFDPERWIDVPDARQRTAMDKYLVPFSRGARNCLGQQLATAETYLALGILFWHFDDLRVDPPLSEEHVEHFDYFSPQLPASKPRMSVVRTG